MQRDPGAVVELPCIRCGDCARACPESIPALALWDALRAGRDDLAASARLADCSGCGECDAICPSTIPLAVRFVAAQARQLERSALLARAAPARERFEQRNLRLQRESREQARRDAALSREASSHDAVAAAIARAAARRAKPPQGGP
ncbi:hypothetical protein BH11PSE14_BH11PSE14_11780 [soil metagenome]